MRMKFECAIRYTGYFQIFATHLKAKSEKRDPLCHFPLFPNVTGELKQLV